MRWNLLEARQHAPTCLGHRHCFHSPPLSTLGILVDRRAPRGLEASCSGRTRSGARASRLASCRRDQTVQGESSTTRTRRSLGRSWCRPDNRWGKIREPAWNVGVFVEVIAGADAMVSVRDRERAVAPQATATSSTVESWKAGRAQSRPPQPATLTQALTSEAVSQHCFTPSDACKARDVPSRPTVLHSVLAQLVWVSHGPRLSANVFPGQGRCWLPASCRTPSHRVCRAPVRRTPSHRVGQAPVHRMPSRRVARAP